MLKVYWQHKKILLGLLLCFVMVICASLILGHIEVSFANFFGVIFYHLNLPTLGLNLEFTPEQNAVLWHLRMPRTLVGILVGAALAVSGAVMQGVFSNPLADPGIMGVSSGATTGAVFAIAIGVGYSSIFFMPMLAFIGAVMAVSVTLLLAIRNGKIPVMTLLLSGVAVSIILGALTSGILTFINEQRLQQYLFWMVGGLDYRRWEHLTIAIWPILIGIGLLITLSRHINVLALGDTEAKAVGMPVMKFRLLLLFLSAMTTAAAVCISGNIGFVGLVTPHIMRLLVGPDHRILLPVCALGGGIFLVFCDTLGRLILAPVEIRVGIMTAIIGAPYFLYLLRKINRYE